MVVVVKKMVKVKLEVFSLALEGEKSGCLGKGEIKGHVGLTLSFEEIASGSLSSHLFVLKNANAPAETKARYQWKT